MYVACAQNSFYHSRMVVTLGTFGLLAVAEFLESSNICYSRMNKRLDSNC